MSFRVFIHTNAQQLLGAKLAAYSFQKMASRPIEVDLIFLNDYPELLKREGQTYRRKGQIVTWRNRDLQSFSPLRFLPPQIMNYQGRALVTDPDVFAISDITELMDRDMKGKGVFCRHVTEGRYTTKEPFYASSVMLLDNAKLPHWNWNQQIDDLFAHKFDYGDWINLRLEDKANIGVLEERWNSFDKLESDTALLHNTERTTQPWKTGLPRDFDMNGERSIRLGGRLFSPQYFVRRIEHRLFGPNTTSGRFYQPHPDRRQEELFLNLTQECLDKGIITEAFIQDNIDRYYVRTDLLKLLKSRRPAFVPVANRVSNEARL